MDLIDTVKGLLSQDFTIKAYDTKVPNLQSHFLTH
jgi:hypothetical protein